MFGVTEISLVLKSYCLDLEISFVVSTLIDRFSTLGFISLSYR